MLSFRLVYGFLWCAKKLLSLIRSHLYIVFIFIEVYAINIQKSVIFLCTNNKLSEKLRKKIYNCTSNNKIPGNKFNHGGEGCLFVLFMVSFALQKLLSLIKSHLFIFLFISVTVGGGSKKILLWFMSKCVFPMFSSKSFIVSGLTFRSLIHFEFIFVYGVRKCSNFILLHVAVQFSHHHLLKRLSFLHCIFLPPLSKIR